VINVSKPVVYQEEAGRRERVTGGFALTGAARIGFEFGSYDTSLPLVVDPVLAYSTYLGGLDRDGGSSIAVDAAGNVYVAGAAGRNFPTASAMQATQGLAFVAKLNSTGTALIYSTYFGGSANGRTTALAVDAAGNAYVTGSTSSRDFPTANPFQPLFGGGLFDVFVTKISPTGASLLYSTYLGGSGGDQAGVSSVAIAVDASGSAYVTGSTTSPDFPTVKPLQSALTAVRESDAFVTKLNPQGASAAYSTYLGRPGGGAGVGIAIDSSGSAYLAGATSSTRFPAGNPIQPSSGGGGDVFVAKIDSAGSTLVYSSYLGGSGADFVYGIAVDPVGAVYLAGTTYSANFPTVNPFQARPGSAQGSVDAFVAKIDPDGSKFAYSTYLGGAGVNFGTGIAIDSASQAYVVGWTSANNFPAVKPLQAKRGQSDAFVAKFNENGSALIFSSYLGGTGDEVGGAIAVDAAGNAFVTGDTSFSDFPTVNPVQRAYGGGERDAFIVKISDGLGPPVFSTGSIVNGASFRAGSLAPDSWVDLYGQNLATQFLLNGNFPEVLDGTTVTISDIWLFS